VTAAPTSARLQWRASAASASALACSAAQTAPAATPAGIGAGDVLGVAGGLLVVLAAVAVTAWAMRRVLRGGPGGRGPLRILSGVSMGPRERVVLLEVGDTQLLLGIAPGSIRTLHVLERPLDVGETLPAQHASGTPFARELGRLLGGGRSARRAPHD